jgi:hypothetical protein
MKTTTVGDVMKKLVIPILVIAYIAAAYGFTGGLKSRSAWESGRFHPVDSNVFDSARYDAPNQTLTLLFRTGEAYAYQGVSRKTWLTFMRVKHKGSFFNAHIRRAYVSRRVGRAP